MHLSHVLNLRGQLADMNTKKFYIAMLLISTVFGAYLSAKVVENFNSKKWPTVAGNVETSHIKQLKKSTNYLIQIEYSYFVNGVEYLNDRFSVMNNGVPHEEAKRLLSKYSKGQQVQVRYEPTNPQVSVLEAEINYLLIFIWFVVVILFMYSIYKIWSSR